MSDKKNIKQSLTGFSKGFSTGIGLQLWLFFLFCFYFLGYPVRLSILLGFAGGFAGGWVVGWWKTKDVPIEPEPKVEDRVESTAKASGLRQAKQRRDAAKSKKRSPGLLTPLDGLIKKSRS